MRLIDADALADALFDQRRTYPQWVADTIGNMPDAIVRCKDCKYFLAERGECLRHHFVIYFSNGNWFCADGERKES